MPTIRINFRSSLSRDDRDLIENYRGQEGALGEIARSAYERRHLTPRQRKVLQNPHSSEQKRYESWFYELRDPDQYWDDPMESWIQDMYGIGHD